MVQIDIDMPKNCKECPLCDGNDDCILLEIDPSWDWDEQYVNCPLIPIQNS